MGLWNWLKRTATRRHHRVRSPSTPRLEPLEPRVLLSADVVGMGPELPVEAPPVERAILVDLEDQGARLDADAVAPALPGLELLDPDLGRLQGQIIHVSFDGQEAVTYDGPVPARRLDVAAFEVPRQLRGQEGVIITGVLERLEETFGGCGVRFTLERPVAGVAHSTIHVGGDDRAFADYGSFLGLAEAVDVGNQDLEDNALVFSKNIGCDALDPASYVSELVGVIAHEAGHLLGYAHAQPGRHTASASTVTADSAGLLEHVAHFAGPDDGESADQAGPVHQWLTYNAYRFYDSQFAGSELADFIGDWTDYGSRHHQSNGDDNDVIEGVFDEDVSAPITYVFDDGFHWDIVPQNPLGQDIPYLRHFVAGGDGNEIYDGWESYASAVTQAESYWDDYVLDNYFTNRTLSYYYLGHVAHLLEDMTVPAHVHNDEHPFRDAYEYTMGEHSNYLLWGCAAGVRAQPTGPIAVAPDLVSLFRETIDYTEEYPSNDQNGDDELEIPNIGRHRPDLVSRAGGFTGDGATLDAASDNEITILADDLMTWAMERVAGLFRLFYRYMDTTAPTVRFVTTFGPSEDAAVLKPSQFRVTASAADDGAGYDADGFTFSIDRKNGGLWEPVSVDPNSGDFQFSADTDGLYRISVEVEDAAGNVGTSSTGYFHIDQARGLAPVYRFWSPVNESHFYTISERERDKLIDNYAHVWTYEGISQHAFTSDTEPDVTPVYRFWSGQLRAHFYTINESEKAKLIDRYAHIWTFERVAFYAYAEDNQPAGTNAVYRFWSPTLRSHFFTMSQTERDKLLELYPLVWTYEGIAWAAYAP